MGEGGGAMYDMHSMRRVVCNNKNIKIISKSICGPQYEFHVEN